MKNIRKVKTWPLLMKMVEQYKTVHILFYNLNCKQMDTSGCKNAIKELYKVAENALKQGFAIVDCCKAKDELLTQCGTRACMRLQTLILDKSTLVKGPSVAIKDGHNTIAKLQAYFKRKPKCKK